MGHPTFDSDMLKRSVYNAEDVIGMALNVDKACRAKIKTQRPCCIWLTGLSGAGKSTLAKLLEEHLHECGRHTYHIDGDNLRLGLCNDLCFTAEDRVENIRRASEAARLMVDAGLIVIVSLIAPFRAERLASRERFEPGEFVEVFVDAPLSVCEQRDVKGLYAKARRGELSCFTGIDSPYEPPIAPEVHIQTNKSNPIQCTRQILSYLDSRLCEIIGA